MSLWKNDLFGCMNNCSVCIITYFVPCYTFGKNAEAVGESCICCAATYLFPFLHLVAHVNIRGKIRDTKGIDGSGCNDFLIALFCPLCALVQEATEIRGEPLGSMASTVNDCNFETGFCGWTQDNNDDFDWTRKYSETPSDDTGPITGHTGDYYIYIEASKPRQYGDKARLVSPMITDGRPRFMTFYYHMYGGHINTLNIYISTSGTSQLTNPEWSRTGNKGDRWINGSLHVMNVPSYRIVIEGIRGSDYKGDIALDDIKISFGYPPDFASCPDNHLYLVASTKEQSLSSPGFPHIPYGNSLRCSWLISTDDTKHSVLKITVHNITLEQDFDYLRIYDGNDTSAKQLVSYTGEPDNAYPQTSSGSDLYVVFTTDLRNAYDGFNISYSKVLTIPTFSGTYSTTTNNNTVIVTVFFTSYFPYLDVIWSTIDDMSLNTSQGSRYQISTKEHKVANTDSHHYETTLTIKESAPSEYKVTVRNYKGISDFIVSLMKVPVIDNSSTDVTVSSASMIADFQSYPVYETMQIYVIPQSVNGLTLPPALANGSADNNEIFWTVSELGDGDNARYRVNLTIPDLREHHLHSRYMISVRNAIGNGDVDIKLDFPCLASPVLNEEIKTRITQSGAEIQVTFLTMLENNEVEFTKNGQTMLNSNKYRYFQNDEETFGGSGLRVHKKTYTIIVNNLVETDFDYYRVKIWNQAGTGEGEVFLNRPPVFPFEEMHSQFDNIRLECTLEFCDGNQVFWKHTDLFGKLIRYLPGQQVVNVNTLKINIAKAADNGYYECKVIRYKDSSFLSNLVLNESFANGMNIIHIGKVQLKIRALPVITWTSYSLQDPAVLHLNVSFYSFPPHRLIRWYKDGIPLDTIGSWSMTRTSSPSDLSHVFYETIVTMPGHNSSLVIRNPPLPSGTYTVIIGNDIGHTTRMVNVHGINQNEPFKIGLNMSVSEDGQDQYVDILFVANPLPTTLSWHHKNGDDVVDNQRFVVELIEANDTQNIYTSRMTIRNITFNDYGTYELKVENDLGYFRTDADIKNPNKGLPVVDRNIRITLTNNTAMVEVTFTSEPMHISVTWSYNHTDLQANERFTVMLEEYAYPQGQHMATLVITDVTTEDMGMYEIAVRNDVGVTHHSFLIFRGCTIEGFN